MRNWFSFFTGLIIFLMMICPMYGQSSQPPLRKDTLFQVIDSGIPPDLNESDLFDDYSAPDTRLIRWLQPEDSILFIAERKNLSLTAYTSSLSPMGGILILFAYVTQGNANVIYGHLGGNISKRDGVVSGLSSVYQYDYSGSYRFGLACISDPPLRPLCKTYETKVKPKFKFYLKPPKTIPNVRERLVSVDLLALTYFMGYDAAPESNKHPPFGAGFETTPAQG